MSDCPNCIDLAERLRIQAASNLALIREHQRQLVERGLRELAAAEALDLRLRAELTGGVK